MFLEPILLSGKLDRTWTPACWASLCLVSLQHRKAKMQREIDGLRRALQLADEPDSTTAAYTNHYRPSSTTDTVAPQAGQRNTTFYSPPHAPTTLTTIPISVQGLNSTVTSDHAPVENLSSFPYTGQSSSASAPQAGKHVTTFCPSLDGLQVEPRKLEDCYSLSVLPGEASTRVKPL